MANPEDYGIDVERLVDALAADEGISIENPHRITPGTAKALARRAVLAAFEVLPVVKKQDLPKWDEIRLGGNIRSFTPPGTLRSMDDPESSYKQLQDNVARREAAGEIGGEMPDLVGPVDLESRIRSSLTASDVTAINDRVDRIASSPQASAFIQGKLLEDTLDITPDDHKEIDRLIDEDLKGTA